MPDTEDRCTICGQPPEDDVDGDCFRCIGYDCSVCDQEILRPDDMSEQYLDNIHLDCEPDSDEEEHELGLERS